VKAPRIFAAFVADVKTPIPRFQFIRMTPCNQVPKSFFQRSCQNSITVQTVWQGGAWKKVTAHIIGKELSGTANITFTVEVSNDGTNFTTHPTADTVAFVNTTSGVFQSKTIEVDNYAYTHIRIKGVGSGTQSTLWYCRLKWAGPI